ncbi:unnamed protein product [Onchocerca flexuosa]|uniref:Secreted protein n=1 Tax=Onchocerca flexuosa TaxID=387005 RepID=A0A183HF13_9BILA|nr:unnamed protein product [Onchocerca flexuosa]
MQIIWSILISGLLIAKPIQCKAIVRVETGRQLIHVKGREPFLGNYIQLIFSKLRCITSLIVDSITPLTGAEEIELIYKICQNDTVWYLTHYSNSGGSFTLRSPTYATVFAVITHKPISIVEVHARPYGRISHKRRKHHSQRFLILEEGTRTKRSINLEQILEFTAENSPYFISKNITIFAEQILKIHAGTVMTFSQNTGIIACGVLHLLGHRDKPILLKSPSRAPWLGIVLNQGMFS